MWKHRGMENGTFDPRASHLGKTPHPPETFCWRHKRISYSLHERFSWKCRLLDKRLTLDRFKEIFIHLRKLKERNSNQFGTHLLQSMAQFLGCLCFQYRNGPIVCFGQEVKTEWSETPGKLCWSFHHQIFIMNRIKVDGAVDFFFFNTLRKLCQMEHRSKLLRESFTVFHEIWISKWRVVEKIKRQWNRNAK